MAGAVSAASALRNALLALILSCSPLLLAAPARADGPPLLAALSQIPSDAALYQRYRVFDIVDVAALRRVAGLAEGTRLADLKALPEAEERRTMLLLLRITTAAEFPAYLRFGAAGWPRDLGADFLELAWFSQPGTPPHNLLLLGGDSIGAGDSLNALGPLGFVPEGRGGGTVWVKGEEDAALDVAHRQPGFPFWGQLGANVRLFRSDEALVGARTWPAIAGAMAVAAGEAGSLADLARYRLAVAAAAEPSLSDGPVMQMTFVDESYGDSLLGTTPSADGLPPFGLYAFAEREDASGHQVLLLLTYDDADTAAPAAGLLADRLQAYRLLGKETLAERFPGLQVRSAVVLGEEGAVAVVRLATPPEPELDETGRLHNRSRLYRLLSAMLSKRDLGFLAVRE